MNHEYGSIKEIQTATDEQIDIFMRVFYECLGDVTSENKDHIEFMCSLVEEYQDIMRDIFRAHPDFKVTVMEAIERWGEQNVGSPRLYEQLLNIDDAKTPVQSGSDDELGLGERYFR